MGGKTVKITVVGAILIVATVVGVVLLIRYLNDRGDRGPEQAQN